MSRRRRTPNASAHVAVAVAQHVAPLPAQNENPELFVDLMMGAPLQIFVEKDVADRDEIVRLIEVGGAGAPKRSELTQAVAAETRRCGGNGVQHGAVYPRYVAATV
jgi:hypothetical protein